MFSAAKPYYLLYIFDNMSLKNFIFQNYQHVTLKLKQMDIKKLLFA